MDIPTVSAPPLRDEHGIDCCGAGMLAAVILALAMSQTGKRDREQWVALVQLVAEVLQTPSAQTGAGANCPSLEFMACGLSWAHVGWALTV